MSRLIPNFFSIQMGYAYILTQPGIPSVFYDHFYDSGDSIHDQIVKLVQQCS
ncbi:putative alpha-amylase [Rosa chinensis]|uniref:Putative alpha-amylase n=1 Tax=Rosa chinensis TaxID=74649 RepID=A0A2P6SII5_ROSCH|nr:putative alpha-amylase [Rosa chinensis]